MKRITLIALVLVAFAASAPAQSLYPWSDSLKTITTAVDTTTANSIARPTEVYHITLCNYRTIDTIAYKTENDSKWSILLPARNTYFITPMHYLYRKTLSGTAVSQAYGR